MAEETAPQAAAPADDAGESYHLDLSTELRDILEAHQQWLDTRGKQGTQARLEGYDFSYLNLANVNLRRAFLKGANFPGAELTGAIFRGADLRGDKFAQADLRRADLRETDLKDADLSEAANLLGLSLVI